MQYLLTHKTDNSNCVRKRKLVIWTERAAIYTHRLAKWRSCVA